jgi:TonB family protein
VQTVNAEAGKAVLIEAKLTLLPTPSPPADPRQIAAALPAPVLPLPTPIPVFEGMFVPREQVDKEPTKIAGRGASVPASARQRKGTVEVAMTITESGDTTDIHVTQSAGPDLDDAVRKAVRDWKFEPALKNGVKVRTRFVHRSTFR